MIDEGSKEEHRHAWSSDEHYAEFKNLRSIYNKVQKDQGLFRYEGILFLLKQSTPRSGRGGMDEGSPEAYSVFMFGKQPRLKNISEPKY